LKNGDLNEFNINTQNRVCSASIQQYIEFLESKNNQNGEIVIKTQPLNQILYGPPGTGKTYNTINKAIEIIENRKVLDDENREKLKAKFEEYKKAGQIEFVTFHQSYGYEEFVEGIKAKTNEETKNIEYKIEAGIFKQLCKKAQEKKFSISSSVISSKATVWKISLGGSGDSHDVKQKCFKDNEIRIGWVKVFDIEDIEYQKLGSKDKSTIRSFMQDMQIGDIVVSLGNAKESDGIGVITSEYTRDDDDTYPHKRSVKWLTTNKHNMLDLNGGVQLTLQTVYKLNRISPDDIASLLGASQVEIDNSNKNYILIIDEINRGNISKIFGELITLIEPSKRIGADEAIKVKLPYSNDDFGVPQNLYIIGTMNTADRSIALMDTALRRRFEFVEMLPNPNLLKDEDGNDLIVDDINIKLMLEKINKRVEYLYDRDHTIGHAYFMSLKDTPTLVELENIFKNKIIPLLQEYFYDDWEKILMVLGDGFIQKESIKDDIFDDEFKQIEYIEDEKFSYSIKSSFDYGKFQK